MLEHVIKRALQTPWAITPEYGAVVQDVLVARARGIRLSDDEIRARVTAMRAALPERASLKAFIDDDDEERDPTQYATIPMSAAAGGVRGAEGVIAVIPVYGVICNRSFDASSGMTSTDFLSAMFTRAEGDPNVKAILFDVSSPGGSVDGVAELAKLIQSGEKARVAFVNALSASAAYWLSAQAHEIVARESAMVGSVGVYALLEDWSEYLAKEGIKINAISAGQYKLEGAPWEPLTDEARSFYQAQVDATYSKFLAAVASGRGTSVADVRKNYGQGRCLMSADALAAGMIDKVGELPVALSRANALARSTKQNATAKASSTPIEVSIELDGQQLASTLINSLRADDTQREETVSPTADGGCPDGYEMGEDGMCHIKQESSSANTSTTDDTVAKQAAADRDALELARS